MSDTAGKRPTHEQAAQLQRRLESHSSDLQPGHAGGPIRVKEKGGSDGGDENDRQNYPSFPDYYYPDDREADTYMAAKAWLASRPRPTGETIPPGYMGELKAGDREIEYLISKKRADELARFKLFCEQSLPRGTPWAREYFEKIMPGWYQSKADIIQNKIGTVQKFITIALQGVQSIEDMELLYALYQGKLVLPQNFHDLLKGTADNTVDYDSGEFNEFQSGLFNPERYTSEHIRMAETNRSFLANMKIPGFNVPSVKGGYLGKDNEFGATGQKGYVAAPIFNFGTEKLTVGGKGEGVSGETTSWAGISGGTTGLPSSWFYSSRAGATGSS